MLNEEKVLDYLRRTSQSKVVIRQEGRLYFCTLKITPGNQYTDDGEYVNIEELPSVIELVY